MQDNYDSDFPMEDLDSYETMVSRQPKGDDYNTFKQRNDPEDIIKRLRLRILNAYEEDYETTDESGKKIKKTKLRYYKNTKPLANKQGVEQIISYVESYINGHCVQAHIVDKIDYNTKMNGYADDITMHFIANMDNWNIKLSDCDILISTTIGFIELFLSRALFNKEREAYTEGFKEVVDRKVQPQTRPSIMQRAGSFLAGGGNR